MGPKCVGCVTIASRPCSDTFLTVHIPTFLYIFHEMFFIACNIIKLAVYISVVIFCSASNKLEAYSGVFLNGGFTPATLPESVVDLSNEHLAILGVPSVCTPAVKTYHRAEVNKIRYYSELYRRTCRRNSYTATYRSKSGEQKCGMFQYFFVSSSVILY